MFAESLLWEREKPSNLASDEPSDFEHHCADELTRLGWAVRVTGGSGDQGVDIIAIRNGRMAVFQCKLYSSPVGNKSVQEAHAGRSFYRADCAAVISNANFTLGARALANKVDIKLLHHDDLQYFDL